MAQKNEIRKDDVTKRAPTSPAETERALSDSELDKAAGGGIKVHDQP